MGELISFGCCCCCGFLADDVDDPAERRVRVDRLLRSRCDR